MVFWFGGFRRAMDSSCGCCNCVTSLDVLFLGRLPEQPLRRGTTNFADLALAWIGAWEVRNLRLETVRRWLERDMRFGGGHCCVHFASHAGAVLFSLTLSMLNGADVPAEMRGVFSSCWSPGQIFCSVQSGRLYLVHTASGQDARTCDARA